MTSFMLIWILLQKIEELEEEFKQIAQSYGREVDEMKKMLSGVTDSISHDIMMRKAVKVIRDNAK